MGMGLAHGGERGEEIFGDFEVVKADNGITISAGKGKRWMKPGRILLVTYAKSRTVSIARGENHGRKITYHNVVSKVIDAGPWKGDAVEVTVPATSLKSESGLSYAIIVQSGNDGKPGAILAGIRGDDTI